MNGLKSRLEKADERIGELADTPEEEIIQNAKQRGEKMRNMTERLSHRKESEKFSFVSNWSSKRRK